MKKLKHWDVSVLGNKPAIQKQNVDFYTSDTDAHLRMKLTDTELSPNSATFTITNSRDGSLVSERVDMVGDTVTYYMRPEVIEHAGGWQLQVVFHSDKDYTTRAVNFTVGGNLLDENLPKLEIVENWKVLNAQLEESLVIIGDIAGNEQERVENEAIRQQRSESSTMKIATLEKDLSDYKATMQGVNINQEVKQTATGYGVVSLPKTAGEGHGQFGLKGLSATNLIENGDFRNGTNNVFEKIGISVVASNDVLKTTKTDTNVVNRLALGTGGTLIEGNEYYITYAVKSMVEGTFNVSLGGSGFNTSNLVSKKNNWVSFSNLTVGQRNINSNLNVYIYAPYTSLQIGETIEWSNLMLINLTQTYGAGNEPSKEECDRMYADYFEGTKSIDGQMRVKSDRSTLYINAPTMRSLPNGVRDEIREDGQGGYEIVQRVSDLSELLATPIIAPLQTTGSLLTRPNGTVYVENAVADAGVYTDTFTVLGKPIAEIDTLIKYDFETGVQTRLDVTQSVISTDKLSFTHPQLTRGDMVFVEYYYTSEQPHGQASVAYYDNRHTIKDTTNGKHYTWDIKSTNGVPSVTLKEV